MKIKRDIHRYVFKNFRKLLKLFSSSRYFFVPGNPEGSTSVVSPLLPPTTVATVSQPSSCAFSKVLSDSRASSSNRSVKSEKKKEEEASMAEEASGKERLIRRVERYSPVVFIVAFLVFNFAYWYDIIAKVHSK